MLHQPLCNSLKFQFLELEGSRHLSLPPLYFLSNLRWYKDVVWLLPLRRKHPLPRGRPLQVKVVAHIDK